MARSRFFLGRSILLPESPDTAALVSKGTNPCSKESLETPGPIYR